MKGFTVSETSLKDQFQLSQRPEDEAVIDAAENIVREEAYRLAAESNQYHNPESMLDLEDQTLRTDAIDAMTAEKQAVARGLAESMHGVEWTPEYSLQFIKAAGPSITAARRKALNQPELPHVA